MFQLQRTGPLAEPEQLFLESPHEPFCIRVLLRVVVTGEGPGDAQGRRGLHGNGKGVEIVSSPVKETLPKENFGFPVGPDTWRAGALPIRHGAVLRCNSATSPHAFLAPGPETRTHRHSVLRCDRSD